MTGNEGLDEENPNPKVASSTAQHPKRPSENLEDPRSHHILPYSSDNIDTSGNSSDSDPVTAIEPAKGPEDIQRIPSFSKPNPVIRELQNISQLQLRYFQLQVELKRVRDELQASGGANKHQENDDNSNETIEDENIGLSSVESSNRHLKSVNLRLQERIKALEKSEEYWKKEHEAVKFELERVKARTPEVEARNEEGATKESDVVRVLREELSEASEKLKSYKLKEIEAKEKERLLVADLEAAKVKKRKSNEISTSVEELEDLRFRLRRTVGIKAQISAMLDEQLDVNDRNERLLSIAEKHISELSSDLSKVSNELEKAKSEIAQLKDQLEKEEALKKSLMKEIEQSKISRTSIDQEAIDLMKRLDSELEARSKEKEIRKGFEQRISQQQEELQRAEIRIQEQIVFSERTAAELDAQKSSSIELKTRLEEGQKRNTLLSNLLAQSSKDFADAQKETDNLRTKLHDTQLELDRLISINSQLKSNQTELHDKLSESERESAKLHQIKTSEISRLHNEINALQSRLQDEADRAKSQLAEHTEKYIAEIAYIRERGKEESNKLRSEKTQRENEYKARIVSLENEILNLKDEAYAIETDRDSLLVRERKDNSQRINLETALSEVSSRLADAESSLQLARSEASEYKNRYDSARRAEEALIEKSRQLEQAVSKQTLRLQELSNEDLGALKRQAQDGVGSVNELMSLREEYSRQAAEWMMVSNSLNLQIQQLAESNKRLEDELTGWRNNESQREAQLRAIVQNAHQHEIEVMQHDYQYSLSIMKSSFAEAENERDTLKKQILTLNAKLQSTEFEFDLVKQQLSQFDKERSAAEKEINDLRATEEILRQSQQSLQNDYDSLSLKLKDSLVIIESNKASEHNLITKLDELQSNLKMEAGRRLNLEAQIDQREKIFKESCERLFAIVYSNSQQIQSLIFIKCYFTKCFPRTDLPNMHDPFPNRRLRTLRGVASFVLANIKFERAYRDGIRRKSKQSEIYLLQN